MSFNDFLNDSQKDSEIQSRVYAIDYDSRKLSSKDFKSCNTRLVWLITWKITQIKVQNNGCLLMSDFNYSFYKSKKQL